MDYFIDCDLGCSINDSVFVSAERVEVVDFRSLLDRDIITIDTEIVRDDILCFEGSYLGLELLDRAEVSVMAVGITRPWIEVRMDVQVGSLDLTMIMAVVMSWSTPR